MRNKNIKTKLFLFLLVLTTTLFCFWKNSLAEEKHLIINEILPNPDGSSEKKNEFIELYNPTNTTIDLTNYYFSGKTEKDTKEKTFPLFGSIEANQYKAFYNTITLYNEKSVIKLLRFKNKNVFDPTDNIIDTVTYPSPSTKENYSYSLILNLNNWVWILPATPNKENSGYENGESDDSDEEEEKNKYAGKLKINEIFPAPKTKNKEKEFVEIINLSDEKIDLSGLRIEDEKNHKVFFPTEELEPNGLFILEGNFEFNNISADSAYLIAKNGIKENPIDSVSYEKPKYDYTYAFDGIAWQWTSKITKGAKNQFDELLSGRIKKDKKIYANVYANFEVSTDKKDLKFTWNFGDDHKSYLKKTRHKYVKSGTYHATLKITGDGKENLIDFDVKVEKFSKTKVQIIALSANPTGLDSKNEWLEIFNNTKKKVNLKNWSVATGWKKLYNHPIKKDFVLKAGETKKLTNEICAFSLGNKKAKIELRYPDGKTADKLKYDLKEKTVAEDAIYQKSKSGWDWVDTKPEKINSIEQKSLLPALPENPPTTTETPPTEKPKETKIDIDLSFLGGATKNPAWLEKQKNQILILLANSNINQEKFLSKNQGRVLGISTKKRSSTEKPTKSFFSFNFFWRIINAKINQLIIYL